VAQSSINITEGAGKRINTWDRTISATLVQDQFTLPGEYPLASYVAPFTSVSTATANSHILQLMAGSANYVRIRRIHVEQAANATAASNLSLQIFRLTTAGTGGTAVTPEKMDSGDAAAGATAQTLPTVKGTEAANATFTSVILMRQVVAATGAQIDDLWEWQQLPNGKPLIIPAGTANGIALKNVAAIAGGTLTGWIEFVETAWLGA
jgi:hypothetical protein